MYHFNNDTICALSTPAGIAALALIRLSGPDTFNICNQVFHSAHKDFNVSKCQSHTIHYGTIIDSDDIIDEVLLHIFHADHSYTGEPSVEITCHGSVYIQQKIIELLISKGARLANPGEYTLRAFLNKRFDLSQAEAVADIIASNSKVSHKLAMSQLRGGFSDKIKDLRKQLIDFASLIELELDFSEEFVEFADRTKLLQLISNLKSQISNLINSFKLGNVLKHGIPVAIIGKPNVGKSTLLNALLNEEKAIVSDIPGTTRDAIEDIITIDGIAFRFIDTAGLRDTSDMLESFGIDKTYQKISQASIILYVLDVNDVSVKSVSEAIDELKQKLPDKNNTKIIVIANKTDLLASTPKGFKNLVELETVFVSAKRKENIKLITESLVNSVKIGITENDNSVVSNLRHYEALSKAMSSLENVETGINNAISTELIAVDINQALYHLGEITGDVTSDEILGNIFANFCIGK